VSEPAPAPARRRAAFIFIYVTLLLDMIALGIVAPVLPTLVRELAGGTPASAATVLGVFGSAYALMQLFASPVLGALGDRFGRRPVVLLSSLGLALDYVLMALAPSLLWLALGRLVAGITSASVGTTFAYIADVTPADRRARAFGQVGTAFGAGFILGPAIGGLLGALDPRLPFWAAAAVSGVTTLYGLLVLPESLPPSLRRPFRWRLANPFGAVRMLRGDGVLARLATVHFLAQTAHVVLPSMYVLYAGTRYGWDEATVGLVLALVGVTSMVVQGALVGPMVRRWGERGALLFGLVCGAAGFLILALAPTGQLSLCGIPLMALWGTVTPALQGLMTARVGGDRQGELQGAVGSVQSFAQLIGPLLFTLTFAWFVGGAAPFVLPGAPFLLAAALLAAALVLANRTLQAAGGRKSINVREG
jgi:DHA1 family tetracycline resistance protein-like MFS transporter